MEIYPVCLLPPSVGKSPIQTEVKIKHYQTLQTEHPDCFFPFGDVRTCNGLKCVLFILIFELLLTFYLHVDESDLRNEKIPEK